MSLQLLECAPRASNQPALHRISILLGSSPSFDRILKGPSHLATTSFPSPVLWLLIGPCKTAVVSFAECLEYHLSQRSSSCRQHAEHSILLRIDPGGQPVGPSTFHFLLQGFKAETWTSAAHHFILSPGRISLQAYGPACLPGTCVSCLIAAAVSRLSKTSSVPRYLWLRTLNSDPQRGLQPDQQQSCT